MTTIQGNGNEAMQGIRQGMRGLQEQAQQVAEASVDKEAKPADLAASAVKSIEYTNAIEASAESLRRSDRAIGELLDVLV